KPGLAAERRRRQPGDRAGVVSVAGRAGLLDLNPAEAEPRASSAAHAAGPEHPDLHHRRPHAGPDGVRRDHGVVAPPRVQLIVRILFRSAPLFGFRFRGEGWWIRI